MKNKTALLKVSNITKSFPIPSSFFSAKKQTFQALDDISFELFEGECLGLVGESGCGKSTLAKVLVHLEEATSGKIVFKETDITHIEKNKLKSVRAEIQMIFQDPFSSLNPRQSIAKTIQEGLDIHAIGTKAWRKEHVRNLLQKVGLESDLVSKFPHQFSGGQRQRIAIARAIATSPKLIICDECVSALDVSIQAQILALLKDLQIENNLSYLFISHNIAVVQYMCDRILVMSAGRILEILPSANLQENAKHPYTKELLKAVLSPEFKQENDTLKKESVDKELRNTNGIIDTGEMLASNETITTGKTTNIASVKDKEIALNISGETAGSLKENAGLQEKKTENEKKEQAYTMTNSFACPFYPRCPQALAICETHVPDGKNFQLGHGMQTVFCHLYD